MNNLIDSFMVDWRTYPKTADDLNLGPYGDYQGFKHNDLTLAGIKILGGPSWEWWVRTPTVGTILGIEKSYSDATTKVGEIVQRDYKCIIISDMSFVDLKRIKRLNKVNYLLITIGGVGRKFFNHPDRYGFSKFITITGRADYLFFIDGGTNRRIYVQYPHWTRGFSEPEILRLFVKKLRAYIFLDEKLPVWQFSPDQAPPEDQHELWDYGKDRKEIHNMAMELGILEPESKGE